MGSPATYAEQPTGPCWLKRPAAGNVSAWTALHLTWGCETLRRVVELGGVRALPPPSCGGASSSARPLIGRERSQRPCSPHSPRMCRHTRILRKPSREISDTRSVGVITRGTLLFLPAASCDAVPVCPVRSLGTHDAGSDRCWT